MREFRNDNLHRVRESSFLNEPIHYPELDRVNEFILERFNWISKIRFGEYGIKGGFDVKTTMSLIDGTISHLLYTVFGKEQKKTITLKMPKSWWNWVKKRYKDKRWMRWLVKLFPIEYNTYTYDITKRTLFPSLDLPPDWRNKQKLVFYNIKSE